MIFQGCCQECTHPLSLGPISKEKKETEFSVPSPHFLAVWEYTTPQTAWELLPLT
jgi:hypothetical protein